MKGIFSYIPIPLYLRHLYISCRKYFKVYYITTFFLPIQKQEPKNCLDEEDCGSAAVDHINYENGRDVFSSRSKVYS